MNDYLCDLLHFHLCECDIKVGCDNCPFNVLTHTTLAGSDYLKEIQEHISDALSLLNG